MKVIRCAYRMLCVPKGATIYVAGPMTNLPEFNHPEFNRVAKWLRECGYNVLNPAETPNGDTSKPRELYITTDVALMAKADAVYMLQGWYRAEGAKLELQIAAQRGIPIFFQP